MDMVKLLVENGADLLVEYGERTAVEFARDHRQFEIADHIKGLIIFLFIFSTSVN